MTVEQPTAGESTEETPAQSGQTEFATFKAELLDELNSGMDKRYAGWQKNVSSLERRINDLFNLVEDVKTSQMSESEREKHVQSKEENLVAQLRAENALLRLKEEFPDAVPVFEQILGKNDPREQLEILQGLIKPSASEQPPTTKAPDTGTQETSGNVDLNNPASGDFDGLSTTEAFEKDPGLADRLLKGVARMRAG